MMSLVAGVIASRNWSGVILKAVLLLVSTITGDASASLTISG